MDTEPMTAGVITEHESVGGSALVAVAGEVDMLTVDELRQALMAAEARSATEIVVLDLTEVSFLGSAGLVVLVDAAQRLAGRGGSLRLVVGAQRAVSRSLQASALDEVLTVCESLEQACQLMGEG
ncbi:MAG TPA: STAS domain-containing protein [Pseudonocardia sp.]|jgi:anti-anti-sigma factor|nr:STAS domain-containing protein [Pseudonocardia sp.]